MSGSWDTPALYHSLILNRTIKAILCGGLKNWTVGRTGLGE